MRDSSTKRSISILTPAALFGNRTREIANRKLSFLWRNSQEHTKIAVLDLLIVIDAKRCLSTPQPFCPASYQRRGIVRPTIPSRSIDPAALPLVPLNPRTRNWKQCTRFQETGLKADAKVAVVHPDQWPEVFSSTEDFFSVAAANSFRKTRAIIRKQKNVGRVGNICHPLARQRLIFRIFSRYCIGNGCL